MAENTAPTPAAAPPVPDNQQPLQEDPDTGLPKGFGPGAAPAAEPTVAPQPPPPQEQQSNEPNVEAVIPDGCPPEIVALAPYLPAGLTLKQIWDWKKQFGAVYFVDICDTFYFYRAMSKPEYKGIMNIENATREIQEEKITELCTLFPKVSVQNLRLGLAGLASSMAEYIMRASAFGSLATPTKL